MSLISTWLQQVSCEKKIKIHTALKSCISMVWAGDMVENAVKNQVSVKYCTTLSLPLQVLQEHLIQIKALGKSHCTERRPRRTSFSK